MLRHREGGRRALRAIGKEARIGPMDAIPPAVQGEGASSAGPARQKAGDSPPTLRRASVARWSPRRGGIRRSALSQRDSEISDWATRCCRGWAYDVGLARLRRGLLRSWVQLAERRPSSYLSRSRRFSTRSVCWWGLRADRERKSSCGGRRRGDTRTIEGRRLLHPGFAPRSFPREIWPSCSRRTRPPPPAGLPTNAREPRSIHVLENPASHDVGMCDGQEVSIRVHGNHVTAAASTRERLAVGEGGQRIVSAVQASDRCFER